MEAYDIHLIINKKRSDSESYPMRVRFFGGEEFGIDFLMPDPDPISVELVPSGNDLGFSIFNVLTQANLWYKVEELYSSAISSNSFGTFFFEIKTSELYHLPWENIFDSPPLIHLSERFIITRLIDKPSTGVIRPLQFPIDVLVFSDKRYQDTNQIKSSSAFQYFHTTISNGGTTDNLIDLLNKLKFEVIQLNAHAEFRENNTSVLFAGNDGTEIRPNELLKLLKRCGARFLILCGTDQNYGSLINFAHHILHQDGPTILYINEIDPLYLFPHIWTLNELYMDIVHDRGIDLIFRRIPHELHPVLFLASGGEDILRISPHAPLLYAKLENKLQQLKNLRDTMPVYIKTRHSRSGTPLKTLIKPSERIKYMDSQKDIYIKDPQFKRLRFIEKTIHSLENEVKPEYLLNFMHESGGLEPLNEAESLNKTIDEKLNEIVSHARRVVNSWFSHKKHILTTGENLKSNTEYNYKIQIGLASGKSNVKNITSIPEDELTPFYSKDGIKLQIELFSTDFQIEQSSKTLMLPAPPRESIPVSFSVITPRSECIAKIRVCIYFEQNLIQSLLVQAVVGNPEIKTKIKGNQAEVDYSLSGSLTKIDRLPSRLINIAVNEDHNGTHSLYIAGKGLKRQFDFGEGEIRSAVYNAREMLQNICSSKDSHGKLRYRYDSLNKGNEKDFIKDVKSLAETGSDLYSSILTNQERTFKDQLRKALGNSEAKIQISSTKSARYVFPWAIVYDKPLIRGNNYVCPRFLSDLKNGGTAGHLNSQSCILNGCINQNDANIICPSGFWGYKHYIEQPLSVNSTSTQGNNELHLDIQAKGIITSLMMGVSLELNDVNEHRKEIETLSNVDVHFMQSKTQIGLGLQRKDFQLIYLYCHGGRNSHGTWLGIGKNERISPGELINGWDVYWPFEHPFVFINGCHTADITPDDLIHFNNTFAWCKASGVMGTEITIPESLARYFAFGFLKHFVNGVNIGKAIREQRLTMLENYNLLGLVYTPYCSADLKIIHTT
jgi:hypothetical protein